MELGRVVAVVQYLILHAESVLIYVLDINFISTLLHNRRLVKQVAADML